MSRYQAKLYTINGETMTLKEFADKYGILQQVLRQRINSGWAEEDLFIKPKSKRKKHYRKLKKRIDTNPLFRWTRSSIECYENGCMCSICRILPADMKPMCKMKKLVLKLVRAYGSPEERFIYE